jgi:hypothetical protein
MIRTWESASSVKRFTDQGGGFNGREKGVSSWLLNTAREKKTTLGTSARIAQTGLRRIMIARQPNRLRASSATNAKPNETTTTVVSARGCEHSKQHEIRNLLGVRRSGSRVDRADSQYHVVLRTHQSKLSTPHS